MASYDVQHIRDLGNQWISNGQELLGYLATMDGSVESMAAGWTGRAGHAAHAVWNGSGALEGVRGGPEHDIRGAIEQAASVATQIGEAINSYADELQRTIKEINKAHLIEAIASIIALLLDVAFMGIVGILGRLAALIEKIVSRLVSSIARIASLAGEIGRAAAFSAGVIGAEAYTLASDLFSQWLASEMVHSPFVIDWASEGINMGLGAWMGLGMGGVDGHLVHPRVKPGSVVPRLPESVPAPRLVPGEVTGPGASAVPHDVIPALGPTSVPKFSPIDVGSPLGAGFREPVSGGSLRLDVGETGAHTPLPGQVRPVGGLDGVNLAAGRSGRSVPGADQPAPGFVERPLDGGGRPGLPSSGKEVLAGRPVSSRTFLDAPPRSRGEEGVSPVTSLAGPRGRGSGIRGGSAEVPEVRGEVPPDLAASATPAVRSAAPPNTVTSHEGRTAAGRAGGGTPEFTREGAREAGAAPGLGRGRDVPASVRPSVERPGGEQSMEHPMAAPLDGHSESAAMVARSETPAGAGLAARPSESSAAAPRDTGSEAVVRSPRSGDVPQSPDGTVPHDAVVSSAEHDPAGAPGHESPRAPETSPGPTRREQWESFTEKHAERTLPLVDAEARLERDQAGLDAAWHRGFDKFARNDLFAGAHLEARNGHGAAVARWHWRSDITRAFKQEVEQSGHVSEDAFRRIVQEAETKAHKYLIAESHRENFAARFKAQVDSYGGKNRFDFDALPKFDREPTKYVFDKELQTYVRDDSKTYGYPGGPEDASGERIESDFSVYSEYVDDSPGSVDHFRDRSHDFNPLEQHFIGKREQVKQILDGFLNETGKEGTTLPGSAGRAIDQLVEGLPEDLRAMDLREHDIRTATEQKLDDVIRWNSKGSDPLPEDIANRVRLDAQRELRADHDLIFQHGDGVRQREYWDLAVDRAADGLPGRIAKEKFVTARLADESGHMKRLLSDLEDDLTLGHPGDHGQERVLGEYLHNVRKSAGDLFDEWQRAGHHGAQDIMASWAAKRDGVRAAVPGIISHERDLQDVVHGAAHTFHEILRDPEGTILQDLSGATRSRLGNDFRTERVTKYDELYALEGHKTDVWLAHDSAREDGFQTTLGRLLTEEPVTGTLPGGPAGERPSAGSPRGVVEPGHGDHPGTPVPDAAADTSRAVRESTADEQRVAPSAVAETRQPLGRAEVQTQSDHASQHQSQLLSPAAAERDMVGSPGTTADAVLATPRSAGHAREETAAGAGEQDRSPGLEQQPVQAPEALDLPGAVERWLHRHSDYSFTREEIDSAYQGLLEQRPAGFEKLSVSLRAAVVGGALDDATSKQVAAVSLLLRQHGTHQPDREIQQADRELSERFGAMYQRITPDRRAHLVAAHILDREALLREIGDRVPDTTPSHVSAVLRQFVEEAGPDLARIDRHVLVDGVVARVREQLHLTSQVNTWLRPHTGLQVSAQRVDQVHRYLTEQRGDPFAALDTKRRAEAVAEQVVREMPGSVADRLGYDHAKVRAVAEGAEPDTASRPGGDGKQVPADISTVGQDLPAPAGGESAGVRRALSWDDGGTASGKMRGQPAVEERGSSTVLPTHGEPVQAAGVPAFIVGQPREGTPTDTLPDGGFLVAEVNSSLSRMTAERVDAAQVLVVYWELASSHPAFATMDVKAKAERIALRFMGVEPEGLRGGSPHSAQGDGARSDLGTWYEYEVRFGAGSKALSPEALAQVDQIAELVVEIARENRRVGRSLPLIQVVGYGSGQGADGASHAERSGADRADITRLELRRALRTRLEREGSSRGEGDAGALEADGFVIRSVSGGIDHRRAVIRVEHRPALYPAMESDLVSIRYAAAAAAFEERLGRYLIQRPQATEAVRSVARMIWEILELRAPDRLHLMGNEGSWDFGNVGNDVAVLRDVLDSGHLRELSAMLYNVVSEQALEGIIKPPTYEDFPTIGHERRWRRASPPLIRPQEAFPPLSAAERTAMVKWDASGREYVRWSRAREDRDLPFGAPLHRDGDLSHALVSTGTSGSLVLIVETAWRLMTKFDEPLDLTELMLGLTGHALQAGHHTLHELLRAAELWDSAHNRALGVVYADGWGRYRQLLSLTEQELREHVAENGLFPDEIALGVRDPRLDGASAATGLEVLAAMGVDPRRWAEELDLDRRGVSLRTGQPGADDGLRATRLEAWSHHWFAEQNLEIAREHQSELQNVLRGDRANALDPRGRQEHEQQQRRGHTLLQERSRELEAAADALRATGHDPDELRVRFHRWISTEQNEVPWRAAFSNGFRRFGGQPALAQDYGGAALAVVPTRAERAGHVVGHTGYLALEAELPGAVNAQLRRFGRAPVSAQRVIQVYRELATSPVFSRQDVRARVEEVARYIAEVGRGGLPGGMPHGVQGAVTEAAEGGEARFEISDDSEGLSSEQRGRVAALARWALREGLQDARRGLRLPSFEVTGFDEVDTEGRPTNRGRQAQVIADALRQELRREVPRHADAVSAMLTVRPVLNGFTTQRFQIVAMEPGGTVDAEIAVRVVRSPLAAAAAKAEELDPQLYERPGMRHDLAVPMTLQDDAFGPELGQHYQVVDAAMRAGRAVSSWDVAAFSLESRGAYAQENVVFGLDEQGVGRDWSGGDLPSVDMERVTVQKGSQTVSYEEAPWVGKGPLYYVVVAAGDHETVTVKLSDGATSVVEPKAFAELLAHDRLLLELGGEAQVVLLWAHASRMWLDFPREVAARTGCTVWAHTGDVSVQQVAGFDHGDIVLVHPPEPGLIGEWIRSEPEDVVEGGTGEAVRQVRLTDGSWLSTGDVRTVAVTNDSHRPIGRMYFGPTDEAGRAVMPFFSHFHSVSEWFVYDDALRAFVGEARSVPWKGDDVYLVGMHGLPGVGEVTLRSGRKRALDGRETARLVRSRSLERAPKGRPIALSACWAATAKPMRPWPADPLAEPAVGQHVANKTGRTVFAPNGRHWYNEIRNGIGAWDDRTKAAWREFRPEPSAQRLGRQAAAMGLSRPEEQQTRRTALRLVRALREFFGPFADDDAGLLRGMGALEAMRHADPVLRQVGHFTLDMLDRVVRSHLGMVLQPGVEPSPLTEQDRRHVLEAAERRVQETPAATLSDFAPLPAVESALGSLVKYGDNGIRYLAGESGRPVTPVDLHGALWALTVAHQILDGRTDREALGRKILHLDEDQVVDPSALVRQVARAAVAGYDVYDPASLGAFDLIARGALHSATAIKSPTASEGIVGRNWTGHAFSEPVQPGTYWRGQQMFNISDTVKVPGSPFLLVINETDGRVAVPLSDGTTLQVTYEEFAQLVKRDPALGKAVTHKRHLVPVGAVPGDLRLAQALAARNAAGRRVLVSMYPLTVSDTATPGERRIILPPDGRPAWTVVAPPPLRVGPDSSRSGQDEAPSESGTTAGATASQGPVGGSALVPASFLDAPRGRQAVVRDAGRSVEHVVTPEARPSKGKEVAPPPVDDGVLILAGTDLTDARQAVSEAWLSFLEAEERYGRGEGSSSGSESRHLQAAWEALDAADLKLGEREDHWYTVSGGLPLPEVKDAEAGAGVLPGAGRLRDLWRSFAGPERALRSVPAPAKPHVVVESPAPLEATAERDRLPREREHVIPTSRDIRVAHLLLDPGQSHGPVSGGTPTSYRGELRAEAAALDARIAEAGRLGDESALGDLRAERAVMGEDRDLLEALDRELGDRRPKRGLARLATWVMVRRSALAGQRQEPARRPAGTVAQAVVTPVRDLSAPTGEPVADSGQNPSVIRAEAEDREPPFRERTEPARRAPDHGRDEQGQDQEEFGLRADPGQGVSEPEDHVRRHSIEVESLRHGARRDEEPERSSESAAQEEEENTPTAWPADHETNAVAETNRAPWYVEHGMLGEFTLRGVEMWDREQATEHAARVAQSFTDPSLRKEVADRVTDMLAAHDLDAWRVWLERGQHVVLPGGRVAWLRPELHRPRPADEAPTEAVRQYTVRFASTSLTVENTREHLRTADVALFVATHVAGVAASTVVAGPQISAHSAHSTTWGVKQNVVSGRKLFVEDTNGFLSDLHFRLSVNGVEQTPTEVADVPLRVAVEFPRAYSGPSEPAAAVDPLHGTFAKKTASEGASETASEGASVSTPRRHRMGGEVLNGLDLRGLVDGLTAALLGAGVSPRTTADVVQESMEWLTEPAVRNRSRWWLTSGDVSTAIVKGVTLPGLGGFQGHFRATADLDDLRFIGRVSTGTREDLGTGLSVVEQHGGKNAATVNAVANVMGVATPSSLHHSTVKGLLPWGTLSYTSESSWSHGLTSEALTHTILKSTEEMARYRAAVTVTLEWTSRTHPKLDPVRVQTHGDLSVPWRGGQGAREFEESVLGEVRTPELPVLAPVASGSVAARRHGGEQPEQARLQESIVLAGRLATRLASLRKHGGAAVGGGSELEPLALASRRGVGYAVAAALPGAEMVERKLRAVLRDMAPRRADVDWTSVDGQLASYFGRPALEGEVADLLVGLHRDILVGGRTFRLKARAHLLEHRGMTGYDMTVNRRATRGETVVGNRGRGGLLQAGFGAAARVEAAPDMRLQAGAVRFTAAFGAAKGVRFTNVAKSYRRMENVGHVDEHRYDVLYELSVAPANRPRKGVTYWLEDTGNLMAQLVVPQAHVPTVPVPEEERSEAGTVARYLRQWPQGEDEFDFGKGAAGLYPSFLSTDRLLRIAGSLYSAMHGVPLGADREEGWPVQLTRTFLPTTLVSFFGHLADPAGLVVRLPEAKGWQTAMTVRIRGYRPVPLPPPAGDQTTEIEQYSQGLAERATTSERTLQFGVAAAAGLQVRFGSDSGNEVTTIDPFAEGGEHQTAPGGRHVTQAVVEGRYLRGTSKERSQGGVAISRVTYPKADAYRADAVWEITLERWRRGHEHEIERRRRLIRIVSGLDLLIPERRLEEVLPPPAETGRDERSEEAVPAATSGASVQVSTRRVYWGGRPLITASHAELLRADSVFDHIARTLKDRGVLSRSDAPTSLRTALLARFRSESLESQWTQLATDGVYGWFPFSGTETSPLSGIGGGTNYLWVHVKVARIHPATLSRDRDEVKLTLRGEGVEEEREKTFRGHAFRYGATFAGRGGEHDGGEQSHGGVDLGLTRFRMTGHGATEKRKVLDIFRANPKDRSVEFQHGVDFEVRMALTSRPPETLRALNAMGRFAVTAGGRLLAGLPWRGGSSATRQRWRWQHTEKALTGEVRLLTPRFMTAEADTQDSWTPRQAAAGTPQWDPAAVSSSARGGEIPGMHPWDVPAAVEVAKWARAVALTGAKRGHDPRSADLAALSAPDTGTTAGWFYEQATSMEALRVGIRQLLAHTYEVPVADRKVTVGFELVSARRRPEADHMAKGRQYKQASQDREAGGVRVKGTLQGFGPEGGGGDDQVAALARSAFDTGGLSEHKAERGVSETIEANREATRPHTVVDFEVRVHISAVGRKGRLTIDVPDGLTASLPLDGETNDLEAEVRDKIGHLFTAGPETAQRRSAPGVASSAEAVPVGDVAGAPADAAVEERPSSTDMGGLLRLVAQRMTAAITERAGFETWVMRAYDRLDEGDRALPPHEQADLVAEIVAVEVRREETREGKRPERVPPVLDDDRGGLPESSDHARQVTVDDVQRMTLDEALAEARETPVLRDFTFDEVKQAFELQQQVSRAPVVIGDDAQARATREQRMRELAHIIRELRGGGEETESARADAPTADSIAPGPFGRGPDQETPVRPGAVSDPALYVHPEGMSVRVRGPRRSQKETRTPNVLAGDEWEALPEEVRKDLHKERLHLAVDPQTLAETDRLLHRALSQAARRVAGVPWEASANDVLEALGRKDRLTRGYWVAQDARDRELGRAARAALDAYRRGPDSSRARRDQVVEAIGAGGDRLGAVRRLLKQNKGVALGGSHAGSPVWRFLADNMMHLKAADVDTVYLESVRGDSYQSHVDRYLKSGTMSSELQKFVARYDSGMGLAGRGLQVLLESARRHGVRVVGMDGRPARKPGAGSDALYHRVAAMNTYAAGLVRRDQQRLPDRSRYVMEVGSSHTGTHPGPEREVDLYGQKFGPGEEFPGVDDLLGIPRVIQHKETGDFHAAQSLADTGVEKTERAVTDAVGPVDLLDPDTFRVRTTGTESAELRSLSRVADLDRLLSEYRETAEHDRTERAAVLDRLVDRARTYVAGTKSDFRRPVVQSLIEQAASRADEYRRSPAVPEMGAPATEAVPSRSLRFRERIALAKREWKSSVPEEVDRLEKALLEAGPGARSLVMGAASGDPLWALNVGGAIRWVLPSGEGTQAPQSAPGAVTSIDLDPHARLIAPVQALLDAGGEANRFCAVVLGADLTHIV
ncbi:lonely Cys domain-containing protein [Streptomyces sp. NPDC093228]|uniref:lonely Cys domain-containing protein n=1 Tax=Streptomyces sp. NPDC093228 TaxID=3155070 RepID=UPI003431FA7F